MLREMDMVSLPGPGRKCCRACVSLAPSCLSWEARCWKSKAKVGTCTMSWYTVRSVLVSDMISLSDISPNFGEMFSSESEENPDSVLLL